MKEIATEKYASHAETLPEKRPYEEPALQVFGKLHLMTQGTGGMASDSSENMTKNPLSDRLVKEKIIRIDTHPLGIGLYLFDYKPEFRATCGHGRQFGVMADEVEQAMPEAVSVHPDGYKMVDYALLGIRRTLH